MPLKPIIATLLLSSALLRALADSELQIASYGREENKERLQCRETFFNGTVADLTDPELLLFNATRQSVSSLLADRGIQHTFDPATGIYNFEVRQDIEGYYFCARDTSPELGLPDDRLYRTVVARPSRREVQTTYLRHIGESVTLLSGVGEGALASHYTAEWTKDGYIPYTNISRGSDFSLNINSVDISDNGTYTSEVIITTGSGGTHLVPSGRPINLIVYESPIIERGPESAVVDEKTIRSQTVTFTCVATGKPWLTLSWFKDKKNLTLDRPSHYKVDETVTNDGSRITSTLTLTGPTLEDNGQYICVVTVLGDDRGDERFTAQADANLTVLESDFHVKTVVTEDNQLQLWVELQAPIYFAVTALISFTLTSDTSFHQTVPTHSVLTENTVMVFQLEPHDVPDGFREETFFIQVALRVGSTVSSMVPNDLDKADIANLNEPTQEDCERDVTYRIATITVGCLFGLVALIVLLIVLFVCVYKCYVAHQRTQRRKNMSSEERMHLEEQNKELLEKLCNPSLTQSDREDIKKYISKILKTNEKLLRGDGTNL